MLWQDHIAKELDSMGFDRCVTDPSVFSHKTTQIVVAMHVDDLIASGHKSDLEQMYKVIGSKVMLKVGKPIAEVGDEETFIGRKVRKEVDGFSIRQDRSYVEEMLKTEDLSKVRPVNTPGVAESNTEVEDPSVRLNPEGHHKYRQIVGKLQYLSFDRTDIQYAVKELARRLHEPTVNDLKRAQRTLKYLQRYPEATVMLDNQAEPTEINVYVDSDWAGCKRTRKSTTGGVMMFGNACLCSWSRTQSVQALSSAEAEFYAVGTGIVEGLCMQQLLRELDIHVKLVVHTDSSSGKSYCERLGVGRMKHIELRYLWVQSCVKNGRVQLRKVATADNPGDLGTKHLASPVILKLMEKIQTVIHQEGEEELDVDYEEYQNDGESGYGIEAVCVDSVQSEEEIRKEIVERLNVVRRQKGKKEISLNVDICTEFMSMACLVACSEHDLL